MNKKEKIKHQISDQEVKIRCCSLKIKMETNIKKKERLLKKITRLKSHLSILKERLKKWNIKTQH